MDTLRHRIHNTEVKVGGNHTDNCVHIALSTLLKNVKQKVFQSEEVLREIGDDEWICQLEYCGYDFPGKNIMRWIPGFAIFVLQATTNYRCLNNSKTNVDFSGNSSSYPTNCNPFVITCLVLSIGIYALVVWLTFKYIFKDIDNDEETPLVQNDIDNDEETPLVQIDIDNDEEIPLVQNDIDNDEETPLVQIDIDNDEEIPLMQTDIDNDEEIPLVQTDIDNDEEIPLVQTDIDNDEETPLVQNDIDNDEEIPLVQIDIDNDEETPLVQIDIDNDEETPLVQNDIG